MRECVSIHTDAFRKGASHGHSTAGSWGGRELIKGSQFIALASGPVALNERDLIGAIGGKPRKRSLSCCYSRFAECLLGVDFDICSLRSLLIAPSWPETC